MRHLIGLCLIVALALAGCSKDNQSEQRAQPDAALADQGAQDVAEGEDLSDAQAPEPDQADPRDVAEDTAPDTGSPDMGSPDMDLPDLAPPAEPEVDRDGIDQGQVVELDPEAAPLNTNAFPMGVSSGGMTADGALFWGRAVHPAEQIILRVWRQAPEPGQVVLVFEGEVQASDRGYIKHRLEGLAPWTWYSYAFYLRDGQGQDTARSPVGRVRTALPQGALYPITVGGSACTNARTAPFIALEDLVEEPLDLFISTGDTTYNDAAQTLEQYRTLWQNVLTDPGYSAVLPRVGSYWTWDDHEVDNNWNPETFPQERFEAAVQAYDDSLPVELGPERRLWRSYRWGDTAEFFILDSRGERLPSTQGQAGATYISQAQLDWLIEALRQSPAHFKVILNSVPITRMPDVWPETRDRWQGYDAQRQVLLDAIVEHDVRHVWFLTGDLHVGFVSHVEPSGPAYRVREIALGPGGSGINPLPALERDGFLEPDTVFPSQQFEYGSGENKVTTTLTFYPLRSLVRARFVNARNGEVLFDEVLQSD
jgi:alkaline phosphatase D